MQAPKFFSFFADDTVIREEERPRFMRSLWDQILHDPALPHWSWHWLFRRTTEVQHENWALHSSWRHEIAVRLSAGMSTVSLSRIRHLRSSLGSHGSTQSWHSGPQLALLFSWLHVFSKSMAKTSAPAPLLVQKKKASLF